MGTVSVLIKNTTMPKNCIECPMQFGGWCYVCPPDIGERVAETVEEAVKQGKPDWCPLVEIEGDDVALIVHGKWVEPSYQRKKAGICGSTDAMAGKCRCSVCRHEEPVFEEYSKYNYCPYCGAKMGSEAEDEDS